MRFRSIPSLALCCAVPLMSQVACTQRAVAPDPEQVIQTPVKTMTAYPPARTVTQIDEYHGTRIADPYRWLEDIDSRETADWVAAENELTARHLAAIPQRA